MTTSSTDVDQAADDRRRTNRCDRRVRSTRHRQDAADLPRVPAEDRTVGRVFRRPLPVGSTGPRMFLTMTLAVLRAGSKRTGSPVSTPALTITARPPWMRCISRSWSTGSGRTCAAAPATGCSTSPRSNPRNGLAPHLHAAIRGCNPPRAVLRQVVKRHLCADLVASLRPARLCRPTVTPVWDGVWTTCDPEHRARCCRPGMRPSTRPPSTRTDPARFDVATGRAAHVMRFGIADRHCRASSRRPRTPTGPSGI